MGLYQIILADDHHIFREGLKQIIERKDELKVVGQAANGEELLRLVKEKKPDMIITDLSMPKKSGMEAIAQLKKERKAVKIVVLSMHKEKEFFRKVVARGVDGYLLKTDVFEKVLSSIQTIRDGGKSFSDELTATFVEEFANIKDAEAALDLLTKREKEILGLVAQGWKNREIAEELEVSIRTVESHRLNLMQKLGLENLQDLVKFAVSRGLA